MNYKLQALIKHYMKTFKIKKDEAEKIIAKAVRYYLSDEDVLRMAYLK